MRRPANANRIAVADSGRWGIEARLPLSLPGRLAAAHMRNRLIVIAGLYNDVVNFRSNIFGQEIQEDRVNARSGITCMEHGLPLHEARRRNLEFGTGGDGEINARPWTPVAVGIVDIAAARIKLDIRIAGTADAGVSPERKDARVEDIAFVRAFRLGSGSENEDFSQVAAGGIESSAGRGGEGGDLRGAGFDQIGEIVNAVNGKNVAAIAGAGDEVAVVIEGQGVDKIFVRTPQT